MFCFSILIVFLLFYTRNIFSPFFFHYFIDEFLENYTLKNLYCNEIILFVIGLYELNVFSKKAAHPIGTFLYTKDISNIGLTLFLLNGNPFKSEIFNSYSISTF